VRLRRGREGGLCRGRGSEGGDIGEENIDKIER
jgi:hypothetical protein